MAKNELLPFADGEDANVLPTNQWEALTDILENGFQSGIARSEQVNRVLAQGAVASYVLGQLIVDQLNKDATLNKDTLYQNLVSALQENSKDVCLPLGGGTMMGQLVSSVVHLIKRNTNDEYLMISGGKEWGDGGVFEVFGKNHEQGGAFKIWANNDTSNCSLDGFPDGTLRWGGKNVECAEYWVDDWGISGYRVYNNGVIEQWGRAWCTGRATTTVTLYRPMSNADYNVTIGQGGASDTWSTYAVPNSTTQFTLYNNYGNGSWWRVIGR